MNPSRILLTILVLILSACSQNLDGEVVLDSQVFETQKLTQSGAAQFGYDLAIDGDFMVVGTVNSAVYLYQKDSSGSWQFVKQLVASDSGGGFGSSVAISGNTIVVGADFDTIGTIHQGSAYIFERNQGGSNNWGEVKKLVASDGDENDSFGISVAISGNTVVVAATGDDIGAKPDQGSAYIFERNRGGINTWGRAKKLLAGDGDRNDYFGISVAISGNTVVVGTLMDDIGTNTDQGSAYIFERNQGGTNAWGQVKKLIASDGAGSDWFGQSVTISGNTVLVGVPNHNGSQGSAYLFERNQGGTNAWSEVKQLVAGDEALGNYFGYSVGIYDNTAVVGVPGRGRSRGAAYLYKRNAGGLNMWGQFRKLLASDRLRNDQNGHAVAINGTTIAVGAPWDDNGLGAIYIY